MAAKRSASSVTLMVGALLACRPEPVVSPSEPTPVDHVDAEPEPDDWEAEDAKIDTDADGIPDILDPCPEFASVSDDTDADGIPDAEDACPCDSEDFDGVKDEDGCPDVCELRLDPCALRIEVVVEFASSDAELDAEDEEALREVLRILVDNPDITVEVRGHTNSGPSVGTKLHRLSNQRAERVRDWLVDHGVASDRLTTQGYSESVPIDTNRTAEGRARNRRVDFVRTDNPECAP